MSLAQVIKGKLEQAFAPLHLEVDNESHTHNVPAGSETHFRVLVVSERFQGLSRIARQRLINELLAHELQNGVHALAQRCLTPEEFKAHESEFASPQCYGGSKRG